MKKLLLLLINICLVAYIGAQDIYDVEKNENKFIYGESIKLFLGDKIFVETNLIDNALKDFKIVNTISDSLKTMVIEFTYDKFGMERASILKISNPFEKNLNYRAKIKPLSKNYYSGTSTVPVLPKIFTMETWPYIIDSIVLTDFKLDRK